MKPTHSIEAYIQEVQNNIRWKRARKIATQDLEQHIQDQFDAYVNQGMDSDPALEEAIKSMGDPQKIGKELDCAYRPKINILLIELTTAFLVLGVIKDFLFLTEIFDCNYSNTIVNSYGWIEKNAMLS